MHRPRRVRKPRGPHPPVGHRREFCPCILFLVLRPALALRSPQPGGRRLRAPPLPLWRVRLLRPLLRLQAADGHHLEKTSYQGANPNRPIGWVSGKPVSDKPGERFCERQARRGQGDVAGRLGLHTRGKGAASLCWLLLPPSALLSDCFGGRRPCGLEKTPVPLLCRT